MKRFLATTLALAMMLSLAACGNGGNTTEETQAAAPETQSAETSAAETPAADETAAPEDTASTDPVYGGTATVYYPKFYNYFDPAMMDEYQYAFMYETLWAMDLSADYDFDACQIPIAALKGQLADTWEVADDYSTVTVHLRQDVLFQDGEPYNGRGLVADDVVWSYSRLLGINGASKVENDIDWVSNLYMLEGVEATDDYTVVFTFSEGNHSDVCLQEFMNQKVNIGGAEWDSCPQTWEYAKGTGAYVLTEYVVDNSMTFVKNENYYGVDERYPENKLPYLDEIDLIYIEDPANVLAQAMSGDLDWFGENGKDVLSAAQMDQLSTTGTGTAYAYMSSSPSSIALKSTQEPFSDETVREAMQHAIDIETIDASYFGNTDGITICGLWSPVLSWSTAGEWPEELTAEYTYDPELAASMLDEAGYPADSSGVRFEFEVLLDPLADQDLYQVAADYLSQVGIIMTVTVAAEMMEQVQASQDMADARQSNGYGGGFSSYNLAFMMTGDSAMGNPYGISAETAPEYLDLLHNLGSAASIAEQETIGQELDQMFADAHWGVVLSGVQPSYDWMSNRIGGYNGEKIYYKGNMRTVWSHLWINE